MLNSILRPLAACAALALAGASHGQGAPAYPSRPITIVVVNPAGSGADIIARLVGQKMSENMGQPVVIDNRPGASGIIAANTVAKANPDGYTLLMGSSSSQTIAPSVFSSLPYDPVDDLAPVSMLASTPYLMVVHPSLQVKSVADLIAMAKANPGKLNFAAGGIAVGSTLAGELFKRSAGVDIMMVPYKGTPQATADVVAGQVQMAFSTMPAGIPLVQAGKLRALGITSAHRIKMSPDIPTISESGQPGFDVTTWFGLLAPRATPADIVARLQSEAVKAVHDPQVAEKLEHQGYEVVGTTPQQFDHLIRDEIARYTEVVTAAGIPKMVIKE